MALNTPYKGLYMKDEYFSKEYPWTPFFEQFYPCIKYKVQADEKLNGTDSITVAESAQLTITQNFPLSIDSVECSLTFSCEKNLKVFYKIIKGCSKSKFLKMLKWIIHN